MEKNNETINDRVRILRKTLDMTQVELAGKIGIHGGSLSVIEAGRTDVTEQNILLLATPGRLQAGITVSERWLRTGEGVMFATAKDAGNPVIFDDSGNQLPSDESDLIGIYRQLTPPNKTAAHKLVDALLEAQEAQEAQKKMQAGEAPRIHPADLKRA